MRQSRARRHLTLSMKKSAGRNSAGRKTVYHRGGGSKRLLRKIDLKRSTSSIGIVERIEYDPNRSSRIALVRWKGVLLRHCKTIFHSCIEFATNKTRKLLELTTATLFFHFAFPDLRTVACSQAKCLLRPYGAFKLGLPTIMPPWSKKQASAGSKQTFAKDTFLFPLSSPGETASLMGFRANGETASLSFGSSLGLPRIAVAGVKPAFVVPRMIDVKKQFALREIRRTHCVLWAHRIKRQAALSWQSLSPQERLVGAAEHKHNESKPKADQGLKPAKPIGEGPVYYSAYKFDRAPVTYILASHQLEAGKIVMNCYGSTSSKSRFLRPAHHAHTYRSVGFQDRVRTANKRWGEGGSQLAASWPPTSRYEILDVNYQVGNCILLAYTRMGTWVHNIECNPGQGPMLARSAGSSAKIIKEPASQCLVLVRLPSGVEKVIDSRCRATIGIVSNPNHGARKLRKAGQSRWLGRRPIVRGVAMNPVDHPHGGGEGRTKGGRPSVSPWGKPTKAGFRAVVGMGKRRI